MSFLPDKYEVPKSSGNYLRFEEGENKFRIMDNAVIGYEYWVTDKEGNKKPVRKRMNEAIPVEELEGDELPKHFWAFPVYNYAEEKIQILEITQKGIMRDIRALEKSKDWGDPQNYDLLVTRTGKKLDTKYSVNPVPPKPMDKGIIQYYKDLELNLEALFDNNDPFEASEKKKKDKFIDEVSKEIE